MTKLLINLQNCYGIRKIEEEFDFSRKNTFVIYAPNGVMKTSFAKTFKDLSKNEDSKDLVFSERKTTRIIKDENNVDLLPEEVFVIDAYEKDFKSDKISTLLVKKELKDQYEEIYKDLENEKIDFIKKLKNISQSSDCEEEIKTTFINNKKESFFELLIEIYPSLNNTITKYDFKYNDIFDKKGNIKKFLEKHKNSIDTYIQNYELLIAGSSFFKKSNNTFGTFQADEILKSIKDDSFFSAGHSIELNDKTKITSAKDFEKIVEEEIKKVVEDKELKQNFEKIDKAIWANIELRSFKNIIEKNNLILIELKNYEDFKKKVWLSYLNELKDDVKNLVDSFKSKKQKLEDIINKALETKTDWENAINEFNERFKWIPFKLKIENKEDVVLKINEPSIKFIFQEPKETKEIERNNLLEVLSQWEKRALYILNIIFEVEARKKLQQKTLFIIDDIADSFDYKNKYAIIEYLKDISTDPNFYQIILTHNFDFFRSIQWRILGNSNMKNCLIASKENNDINLESIEKKWLINPFKNRKEKVISDDPEKNKYLIALIPFVRNIIEYTIGQDTIEYKTLTHLLHKKNATTYSNIGTINETGNFEFKDLETIYKVIIPNINLNTNNSKILDSIFSISESLSNTTTETLNLENKIILSIAIRLKTEEFLIKAINDTIFVSSITKDQLIPLINKYKELFPNEIENIILLEQVNLMTPENIHLNSFMYEPILDMSDEYLRYIYNLIKNK